MRGDRIVERRLVVGFVADLEEQVEPADEVAAQLGPRALPGLGQQPRPEVWLAQPGDLGGEREVGDLAIHRVGEERIEGALESENEPDRPCRDLTGHGQTIGVGRGDVVEPGAECVGELRVAGDRDRHRPTRSLDHRAQRCELGIDVEEIGDDLEHAGACCADPLGNADQLVGRRGQGRCVGAGRGLVVAGAARAEAERTGFDALAGELGHCRDVGGGGVFVCCAALAHHVEAKCAVRNLRRDVDVVRALFDGVEELTERVPIPLQPLVQCGAGNVFHSFHQLDQLVVCVVVHGGEPDAAVAHDGGGDAVPRRGLEPRVPGGLAVVVGVDVDDPRDHQRPGRIDGGRGRSRHVTHLDDHTIAYRDVDRARFGPCSVDDGSTMHHEIEVSHVTSLSIRPARW